MFVHVVLNNLTDEFHHTLIPSMNLLHVLISHGHNFSVNEISFHMTFDTFVKLG